MEFEAAAQDDPSAMQPLPQVGLSDVQQFADLIRVHPVHFPEDKRVADARGKLLKASEKDPPEFTALDGCQRILPPTLRSKLPMTPPIKEIRITFPRECDSDSPPTSKMVHYFVLENAHQPRSFRRIRGESFLRVERGHEALLHDFLSRVAIAQAEHGVSEERVPVRAHPCCGVGAIPPRPLWHTGYLSQYLLRSPQAAAPHGLTQ